METLLPMQQLEPTVTLLKIEFSPMQVPGPTMTSSSRMHFLDKRQRRLFAMSTQNRITVNFLPLGPNKYCVTVNNYSCAKLVESDSVMQCLTTSEVSLAHEDG